MHSALEQAHDRYQSLYDFAPVGYLTVSGTGRIVEVNQTAARLLEAERTTLLNTPFNRFVTPIALSAWKSLLDSSLDTVGLHSCELALISLGGSPPLLRPPEVRLVGIRSVDEGDPPGRLPTATDLHYQRMGRRVVDGQARGAGQKRR